MGAFQACVILPSRQTAVKQLPAWFLRAQHDNDMGMIKGETSPFWLV
jgi:hypothetical protein